MVEIGHEIVLMFESYGDPQQIFRGRRIGSFNGRAMLHETLGPSKAGRIGKESALVHHLHGSSGITFDLEGKHPAPECHLLSSDLVTGVRRQAWIVDGFDVASGFQPLRNG